MAKTTSDKDNLNQSVAKIKERLENAANPLIWVGVEVDRYDMQAKTEALIGQLNIPYVTELLSKAILSEDDKQFMGVYDGLASSDVAQAVVKNSDFILALGVWLTDINLLGGVPDFDKTAFVSFDTIKYGSYFSPQVSLEDLTDGLLAEKITCKSQTFPQKPAARQTVPEPTDAITYQGFYDFIAGYVDSNTIICSDASLNYFGSLLIKVGAPGGCIIQSSYSVIGYGAPAATGICLARKNDQRVMIFSGDGGFQMGAQCLSTQTRFQLNPIIFVINNGIYGVEQWLADASVFEADDKPIYKSCILHPWNYSKLSEVFGCQGWKAKTYQDLEEAVTGALANSNSPSIIEVVVPSRSIPDNAKWKAN